MAKFDDKFESSRQDWPTPDIFFEKLDNEFGFNLDLAADKGNTKCIAYFSEDDDALEQDWLGTCWLNPPYGGRGKNSLSNWIEKSYRESHKHKSTIVVLTPARTNTNWWHEYCMKAKEIKFVQGRPRFGNAKYGLPQPLAIIVFSPHDREYPLISTFNFN